MLNLKKMSNHKKYLLIFSLLYVAVLSVQCATRPTSDKSNESDKADKSKNVQSKNNVFTSRTAGFSITKPDSWHFVTAEEHLRGMEKAREQADNEYQRKMIDIAIKSGAGIPLVAMSKYKEPYDGLNPLLTVRIRPNPGRLQPTQILSVIQPSLQKSFTNFKIQVLPKEVQLGRLKAGYMRAQYKEDIEGVSILLAGEFWIVPKGSHFFMIVANTRVDEQTGSRKEIEGIIETIKFE